MYVPFVIYLICKMFVHFYRNYFLCKRLVRFFDILTFHQISGKIFKLRENGLQPSIVDNLRSALSKAKNNVAL